MAEPLADRWTPDGPVPCRAQPMAFFPADPGPGRSLDSWDPEPAKAICRTCPERVSCLTWAMTRERPPLGVWGARQFKDGVAL